LSDISRRSAAANTASTAAMTRHSASSRGRRRRSGKRTWKPEYADAAPEVQAWYREAQLTDAAQQRFGFKNCCAHSDVVKTEFRVDKADSGDEWFWLNNGQWNLIPGDIIHWVKPRRAGSRRCSPSATCPPVLPGRGRAVMRCVLVNGARLKIDTHCSCCRRQISDSYVREIGTRLIYCGHDCYCQAVGAPTVTPQYRAQPLRSWRLGS